MPKTLQEIVMRGIPVRVETDPCWVVKGPFDQAVAGLQTIRQRLGPGINGMDGEELALAKMSYGKDSVFSTSNFFIPNDHLYDNRGEADILIVNGRHSPFFRNPPKTNNYFLTGISLVKRDYDRLRQLASPDASEALKTGVLLLRRGAYTSDTPHPPMPFALGINLQSISTDSFGDNNVALFIFGEKTAANYGRWLKEEGGIDNITHLGISADYAAKSREPFARTLVIPSLTDGLSHQTGLNSNHLGNHGSFAVVSLVPVELAAPQAPQ